MPGTDPPPLHPPTDRALSSVHARLTRAAQSVYPFMLLCSGLAHAAECPPALHCVTTLQNCPSDPRTRERIPTNEAQVVISADHSQRLDGLIRLQGDVTVRQGDRWLRAQEIEYHPATEDFRIPGRVELSDPNIVIGGASGHADVEGTAEVVGTTFVIPARAGHGTADRIRLSATGVLELEDVRYTTCPGPDPDWELRLNRLRVDQDARIGTGVGIRVDFKGIPILYTPYISFPVGNEPKTGFLPPEFGHSGRSGWKLAVPWYWRIADWQDFTLTPAWYTLRGLDLGGEYRWLTERHKGELQFNYLPDDRQTGTDRSFVMISERSDLTDAWRFSALAVNLGDRAWFEDFGSPRFASTVALPRTAELAYIDDDWLITARAQHFQIIDPLITQADHPYTLLPQVRLQGHFPDRGLGFDVTLDGEYAQFRRTENIGVAVNAHRIDLKPALKWPLHRAGSFLDPTIALRYTAYLLDSAPNLTRTHTRTAPMASLGGGLIFERDWTTDVKRRRVQTFEPRFLYAYVPYRPQHTLPIFDTAPPDFNLIQLFQTERYAGPDRLGDVNHIAFGATTRLYGVDGRQVLSATLGELYRFADQRVGLPGETLERRGSSDFIGELDLAAYQHWTARIGWQWDPRAQHHERSELALHYQPTSQQIFNLSYRYRRRNTLARSSTTGAEPEELKQLDASAVWPLGNAWAMYGRMVYSLKDHSSIEQLAGFEYRSCCWGLRLLARRAVGTITGRLDWEIKAQLELTGLSRVGNPVDAFLAGSIQGYSAVRNDFSSIPNLTLP